MRSVASNTSALYWATCLEYRCTQQHSKWSEVNNVIIRRMNNALLSWTYLGNVSIWVGMQNIVTNNSLWQIVCTRRRASSSELLSLFFYFFYNKQFIWFLLWLPAYTLNCTLRERQIKNSKRTLRDAHRALLMMMMMMKMMPYRPRRRNSKKSLLVNIGKRWKSERNEVIERSEAKLQTHTSIERCRSVQWNTPDNRLTFFPIIKMSHRLRSLRRGWA